MCLKSLLYPEEGSGAKSCFHWHPSPSAEGFDDGIWPLAANSIPRLLGIYRSTQRHKCMAPWQPNSVIPVDSFRSWGKEVISRAGNQEIQLGTCSSRASDNLFEVSFLCPFQHTMVFTCSGDTGSPLSLWSVMFSRDSLFHNELKQQIICWENPKTYAMLQN